MSKECCSSSDKKISSKGRVDPFLIIVVAVTVIILFGVVLLGTKSGAKTQVTSDNNVSLSVDSNKFDWGDIDYDEGIVSKSFDIKNNSDSALKLFNVVTSCMCTTAQLKTSEAASKKYAMHEKSSDVFEVKPGDTAQLIVEFNPSFHGPSGVGPINRTVTINTNDSNNQQLVFQLAGNVFKK